MFYGNLFSFPRIFLHSPTLAPAMETEIVTKFTNCQTGDYLQTILMYMGQPKTATSIATDNLSSSGLIKSMIKQRQPR